MNTNLPLEFFIDAAYRLLDAYKVVLRAFIKRSEPF
jgi:hypothetical protein